MELVKRILSSPSIKKKENMENGLSNSNFKYFNVPLAEVTIREGSTVPQLIQDCAQFIIQYGLELEGIFRINGNVRLVQQLKNAFDENKTVKLDIEVYDVMTITSLLKLYLRELPEPIIPNELFTSFIELQAANQVASVTLYQSLRQLVNQLALPNRETLKHVIGLLVMIQKKENVNKMSANSLGIVFGPNIFRFEVNSQAIINTLVKNFILGYDTIFRFSGELYSTSPSFLLNQKIKPAPPPPIKIEKDPNIVESNETNVKVKSDFLKDSNSWCNSSISNEILSASMAMQDFHSDSIDVNENIHPSNIKNHDFIDGQISSVIFEHLIGGLESSDSSSSQSKFGKRLYEKEKQDSSKKSTLRSQSNNEATLVLEPLNDSQDGINQSEVLDSSNSEFIDKEMKCLAKLIKSHKRKIEIFEEKFEKDNGIKPSKKDKVSDKEIKNSIMELSKARSKLKNLKNNTAKSLMVIELTDDESTSNTSEKSEKTLNKYSKFFDTSKEYNTLKSINRHSQKEHGSLDNISNKHSLLIPGQDLSSSQENLNNMNNKSVKIARNNRHTISALENNSNLVITDISANTILDSLSDSPDLKHNNKKLMKPDNKLKTIKPDMNGLIEDSMTLKNNINAISIDKTLLQTIKNESNIILDATNIFNSKKLESTLHNNHHNSKVIEQVNDSEDIRLNNMKKNISQMMLELGEIDESEIKQQNAEEIIKQKLKIQKALLDFEEKFGRPNGSDEKHVVKPLYDQYRKIKQLLIDEGHNTISPSIQNYENSPSEALINSNQNKQLLSIDNHKQAKSKSPRRTSTKVNEPMSDPLITANENLETKLPEKTLRSRELRTSLKRSKKSSVMEPETLIRSENESKITPKNAIDYTKQSLSKQEPNLYENNNTLFRENGKLSYTKSLSTKSNDHILANTKRFSVKLEKNDSAMCSEYSVEQIDSELSKVEEEKKMLLKKIRAFEDDFCEKNNRKVCKEDRGEMEIFYTKYKEVKVKLNFLSMLREKKIGNC